MSQRRRVPNAGSGAGSHTNDDHEELSGGDDAASSGINDFLIPDSGSGSGGSLGEESVAAYHESESEEPAVRSIRRPGASIMGSSEIATEDEEGEEMILHEEDIDEDDEGEDEEVDEEVDIDVEMEDAPPGDGRSHSRRLGMDIDLDGLQRAQESLLGIRRRSPPADSLTGVGSEESDLGSYRSLLQRVREQARESEFLMSESSARLRSSLENMSSTLTGSSSASPSISAGSASAAAGAGSLNPFDESDYSISAPSSSLLSGARRVGRFDPLTGDLLPLSEPSSSERREPSRWAVRGGGGGWASRGGRRRGIRLTSDVSMESEEEHDIDAHLHHLLSAENATDHEDVEDEDDSSGDEVEDGLYLHHLEAERAGYRERVARRVAEQNEGKDAEGSPVIRIKKEPVDDTTMSDIPPPLSPPAPTPFAFPIDASTLSSTATSLPSLLDPAQFMRGVQAQILSGIPSTVSYLFNIIEDKLTNLKQLSIPKPTSSNVSGTSPVPKVAPGMLAEARATIDKLRHIQTMIETPLFANSTATSTTPASSTTTTSTSAATTTKPIDIPITNELSAFRAVLVQALLTFLVICQRAKSLQQQSSSSSSTQSKESRSGSTRSPTPTAAATSTSPPPFTAIFRSWFPSDRLGRWKLLIAESLYFIHSTPSIHTAAPELTKHLKKILVFLCSGSGSGSDADVRAAKALTDSFVFEREFGKILTLLDLLTDPSEQTIHMDEASGQVISTSFTHFSPSVLSNLAETIFARRSLLYPIRCKLLTSIQAIEELARKRSDSFLAFILNKSTTNQTQKESDPSTHAEVIDSLTADSKLPLPRSKLIYLLYLLSLHFQPEDEELPAMMNLLGIVAQYLPQMDPDYIKAVTAQKTIKLIVSESTQPQPLQLSSTHSLIHRQSSTPTISTPAATAATPSKSTRSSSGGTVLSSLVGARAGVVEEKKEMKEQEEKSEPSKSPIADTTPTVDVPTLLTPLFDYILDTRTDYLFGFLQRHLLDNGSISVRTHAANFIYLLWRSLSTGEKRRSFFNDIFTTFIDGRTNHSTPSTTSSTHSLASLAFYGSHVRQYLTLCHTMMMDSKHRHQHRIQPKQMTVSESKGDLVGMEIDHATTPPTQLSSQSTFRARAPPIPAAPSTLTNEAHLVDDSECISGLTALDCSTAIRRIMDCLHSQSMAFQSHPLVPYYNKLQTHFDLAPNQYFIQNCVCSICNGRASTLPKSKSSSASPSAYRLPDSPSELSWNTTNLKDAASEQKYTHCTRTAKFSSLQTIHQIHLKISGVPAAPAPSSSAAASGTGSASASSGSSRHRSAGADGSSLSGMSIKHIKLMNVYFSSRTGVELAALPLPSQITKPTPANATSTEGNEFWTLARSIEVADTSVRDVKILFPIGLHASAICIHFADFFENFDAVSEGLVCPRCLIPVASRSSQCSRCRETVGQCLRCRAIDYEHPDAFQCGECSHSRYGTFNFILQYKPSTFVPPIQNEIQRKAVMAKILTIQDKIAVLLNEDMDKLKKRLLLSYEQGGSRITIQQEYSLGPFSKSPPPTTTTTSKKSAVKSSESRLDYRHLPLLANTVAPPSASGSMRTVYEIEASMVHNKLSDLYRELQQHRAELFLYLHNGNPFYHESHKSSTNSMNDEAEPNLNSSPSTSSLSSSSIRSSTLPATDCYGCAKHFLILGMSFLYDLDIDCLVSGHAGGDRTSAMNDMNLCYYFMTYALPTVPNPFPYETTFLLETSWKLLVTFILYHDDDRSKLGTVWMEQVLEKKITLIIQHQATRAGNEVDRLGYQANLDSFDLFQSLMSPIYQICTADLFVLKQSVSDSNLSPDVFRPGMAARFKFLFRILLVALRAGGAQSTSISRFVLRPIITLLVHATQPPKEEPVAPVASTTATKSSDSKPSSSSARRTAPASSSSSIPIGLAPVGSQAISRSELRDLLGGAVDLDHFLGQSRGLSAWPNISAAASRLSDSVISSGGLPGIPGGLGSLLFGSSTTSGSSSSSAAGASSNSLPSALAPSLVRRPSGSSTSPSLHPANSRRTSFQRSPGLHPTGSPGSSRLGRAGRVGSNPGSTQQTPVRPPSASPLPPLSLELEAHQPQLTIQALTHELLTDARSVTKKLNSSSSVNLANWLLSHDDDSSSAFNTFQTWINYKREEAEFGTRSSTRAYSPAPTAATTVSLRSRLEGIIDRVFDLPLASNFRSPMMDDHDGEGGMDLTTIRSKLAAGKYTNPTDFLQDVRQIAFYAEIYRGPAILQQAKELTERIVNDFNATSTEQKESEEKEEVKVEVNLASLKMSHAKEWRRMQLAQWTLSQLRRKTHPTLFGLVFNQSTFASLLLCPSNLQLRQLSAQLVWNLSFPTHTSTNLQSMPPVKPATIKARKRLTNANTPAMALKLATDAPIQPRVYNFIRIMIRTLANLTHADALYSKDFFSLFSHLLHASPVLDARFKHYAVLHGIVPIILTQLERELQAIETEEKEVDFVTHVHHMTSLRDSSMNVNSEGVHKHHALYGLTVLLSCLLDDPLILAHFKSTITNTNLLLGEQVMSFFLRIRGLMLVHSKWLDLCSGYLNHMIKTIFSASDDKGKRATLLAYVYALNSGRQESLMRQLSLQSTHSSSSGVGRTRLPPLLNPHITIYILEALCDLIKPPQLAKQCLITFKKSPTQEEYIRGNMKRSPYLSSSFAPANATTPNPVILFRHIKDAICTQLKLDNEENILELLVGGKIVKLDVPVLKMYQKWFSEQHEGAGFTGVTAQVRPGGSITLIGASPSMSPMDSGDGDDEDDESNEIDLLAETNDKSNSTVLLAGDVPMTVTYRLTGLDGEATEPVVDSLPDDEQKVLDPEVEFALAGALNGSGLRVLLYRLVQSIPNVRTLNEDVEVRLVGLLLKLLTYAAKLNDARAALLDLPPPNEFGQRPSAVPFCFRVLVDKLILTLKASNNAPTSSALSLVGGNSAVVAPAVATSPILTLSLELVNLLTVLLRTYAERGQARLESIASLEQHPEWNIPTQQLQALLSCLSLPSVRAHTDLTQQLLSIIPLLSFGQRPLLKFVEGHFTSVLDMATSDRELVPDEIQHLESFAILAEQIPRGTTETKSSTASSSTSPTALTPSPIGSAIRDYFFASGLVQRLFTFLQSPPPLSSDSKSTDVTMSTTTTTTPARSSKKRTRGESDDIEQTVQSLKDRPTLPYILRILTGLVYGHPDSQSLAPKLSIIKLLQQLEGIASSTRVGPLAESLLQGLMLNNSHVSGEIDELRGTKRQEKKRKALDQRAKVLAKMGFKQTAGGKVGLAQPSADSFLTNDAFDENEHALKCIVCQEGYSAQTSSKDKSSNALGFYVFNQQTSVGLHADDDNASDGDSMGEGSVGVTTVTHFNLIHYRCHQEACRADKKLKPPKSEWDGATIRNQHTLCNNLFPILQPPASVITGVDPAASSPPHRISLRSSDAAAASAKEAPPTPALHNPASPLWDTTDMDASIEHYGRSVESYWSHIPFHSLFAHTELELVLEDLRTLLSRFALLESFSAFSHGGGKESNIQFIPYLAQMAIYLYQSAQTSTTVKDRIDQQLLTACQVLGGIELGRTTSGSIANNSETSSARSSSIPLLSQNVFDSSSTAAAGGGNSSSGRTTSSSSASSTKLSTILDLARSPLHELTPSSYTPGTLIGHSLYSDPLDYLEYLMVLSLIFLSPQQWDAIKYPLLWRMLRQVKENIILQDQHHHLLSASDATTTSPNEKKESESKMDTSEDIPAVDRRQLELESIRPILLFWSLINSLHATITPPTGSSYHSSTSETFLSSTTCSSYRRWSSRRSFTRATVIGNFRSIARREQEILKQLVGPVLATYEKQASTKEIQAIIEMIPGVKTAIQQQEFTIETLIQTVCEGK